MPSTLEDISWPVRTPRLSLRPAVAEDLDATWRFRRLPEVGLWMTSATEDKQVYAARFLHEERLAKTLVAELEGVVIADLMVAVGTPWAQAEVEEQARGVEAELGWCLDPRYGGRGYATEAVERLLRLCFEELGLRRVTAECFADNGRSWQLMERLGMRREAHTVADSLHRSGRWLDALSYAMLATEWQSANGLTPEDTPSDG